jgi:hypothetical protein
MMGDLLLPSKMILSAGTESLLLIRGGDVKNLTHKLISKAARAYY